MGEEKLQEINFAVFHKYQGYEHIMYILHYITTYFYERKQFIIQKQNNGQRYQATYTAFISLELTLGTK